MKYFINFQKKKLYLYICIYMYIPVYTTYIYVLHLTKSTSMFFFYGKLLTSITKKETKIKLIKLIVYRLWFIKNVQLLCISIYTFFNFYDFINYTITFLQLKHLRIVYKRTANSFSDKLFQKLVMGSIFIFLNPNTKL